MTPAAEIAKALHAFVDLAFFWCACYVVLGVANLIVRAVKD